MKKIFAAAALLLAMTACGGSQKEALPLEGTTWKLAKMEAIPAKAIDAEADFFRRYARVGPYQLQPFLRQVRAERAEA